MRKRIKYLIIIGIFFLFLLGSLFFNFEQFPENFQSPKFLDLATQNDVIIIFNSGGWGNTPLEKAEDFAPIVKGIQETLNNWGYNSIILEYTRTKDDLSGKITGIKEFLNSFSSSSEILAEKVKFLTENLPDKKIIIAGLSAGGAFVDETMKKIGNEAKVYAIAAGIPFWHNTFESENILQLNNNGKDSLSKGEIKSLILTLIKAPFKWIGAKIRGGNLSFSQALQIPGHRYSWSEIKPDVIPFLENKLTPISH